MTSVRSRGSKTIPSYWASRYVGVSCHGPGSRTLTPAAGRPMSDRTSTTRPAASAAGSVFSLSRLSGVRPERAVSLPLGTRSSASGMSQPVVFDQLYAIADASPGRPPRWAICPPNDPVRRGHSVSRLSDGEDGKARRRHKDEEDVAVRFAIDVSLNHEIVDEAVTAGHATAMELPGRRSDLDVPSRS